MRRLALVVLLACVGAGWGAGRVGGSDAVRSSPSSSDPAQAAPPLSRAIGRKIVTGMDGTFPSRALRARVQRGQVGGVILFGPNVGPGLAGAIGPLQRRARAGGTPPLLIAVDQEGGAVKRLP